jgi:glycosyltransferase involved in cell wall biosynthesis
MFKIVNDCARGARAGAGNAMCRPTPTHLAAPRILFIVNVAWFFISHRLALARAARAAGYQVHLLTDGATRDEAAALTHEGFALHQARIVRGMLDPLGDCRLLLEMCRVIRAVRPHIVHNVTAKPVLYGTIAARLLRVPVVINAISGLGYSFSDDSRWLLSRLLRLGYRWVLRSRRVVVILQNEDDERAFLKWRLAEQRQIVLIRGSGVDLHEFAPLPEPEDTVPLVVLAARMLRDKGVEEFAHAARLLAARGRVASFVCAGPLDPDNPAALSAADMERLQSETPLRWLGPVRNVPDLYRRAHVICLPSYREGLPKSLIEACAAGRPIVTTDVPGCREVVTEGINGLLVPARDPLALADALERLVGDRALRLHMGAAARLRAERDFGLDGILQQTLDLYARAGAPHP